MLKPKESVIYLKSNDIYALDGKKSYEMGGKSFYKNENDFVLAYLYTGLNYNMTLSDKEGNTIKLYESLDGIADNLLQWYADILFHELYKISNEFKDCCIAGKKDVFEWEELK